MMKPSSREFTGKHMLFVMLGFYGVIVAVNLTMAVFANTSWTGFVVENSYIASQEFDKRSAEGRAQAALGWTGELDIRPGEIRYRLLDGRGNTVPLEWVIVDLHRPTSAAEDQRLELAAAELGTFSSEIGTISDGVWIIEITAEAGIDLPWRDVRRVILRDGALK